MPNQLNKDQNKVKGKDGIRTAQKKLILTQQAERRRRFQKIARAWSEFFVRDTLSEGTTSKDPSSPRFAVVETAGVGEQTVGVGELTVGVGVQTASVGEQTAGVQTADVGEQTAGVQTAGVGVQAAGVGVQSHGVGVNSANVAGPNNTCAQNPVVMAEPKEKLPKFDGDCTADPI